MKSIKTKVICGLSAVAVATSAVLLTPGSALGQDIRVLLNGQELTFATNPRIVNGTTLVPMRKIFEELGMSVSWNNLSQTAVAVKNGKSVVAQIGNATVAVNGQPVEAGAAPALEDGTTLVPLRVIGDALGIDVGWDGETGTVTLTDEDKVKDESWKENLGTIDITSMTVDGVGLAVDGRVIEITGGGDYTVTGVNDNAMIHVNTEDRVKLRLSGVNLTNPTGPAIFFENSDKSYITITKDTENVLTDGTEYDVDAKGALFSNDDLEIKGSGTLTINANYKHGIASDDDLKIEEGTINITAKGDGIHANDEITITDGSITIKATGDGIQSESFVDIKGGTVNIVTDGEVEQSSGWGNFGGRGGFGNMGGMDRGNRNRQPMGEQPVQDGAQPPERPQGGMQPPELPNGEMSMQGGAPMQGGGRMQFPDGEMPQGGFGGQGRGEIPQSVETEESSAGSSKGIKAETNLIIRGGDITVNSTDHSLHSAGMIFIEGGEISLTSQQKKGISAHTGVIIEDGNIEVLKSTEGIESKDYFCINGGNINVTASDDGLNAGGTNGRDVREGDGHNLYINGGSVHVNAGGDGIDANGSIYIGGGEIYVDGPTNSGDGALDSGASIVVKGGELVAVGSSGMAEYPRGEGCTQPSVSYTTKETQAAGTEVRLESADGSVILTHTAAKTFQNVVFSSAALKQGETYNIYLGGELIETFTLESMSQTIGSFGGGFGGGRGRW
ncbi:MAG: carbohydrate-binding domain-containing protein [Oscillospiraceae bacterium]|nr:carbohydrate-binding domain-containing protein [Oscillospiraceae bacterium]